MQSVKAEKIQVEWLIQQISQLDSMIELHQNGGSEFMTEQYRGRRLQFFQELISLLASSRLNSPQYQIFPLITALIRENYPRRKRVVVNRARINSLEKVSSLYQKEALRLS